jgi:hypothetical protein
LCSLLWEKSSHFCINLTRLQPSNSKSLI